MDYTEQADSATLAIAAQQGTYPGRPAHRSWTIRFTGTAAPAAVLIDGHRSAEGTWSWDPATNTVTVRTPPHPVDRPLTVQLLRAQPGH